MARHGVVAQYGACLLLFCVRDVVALLAFTNPSWDALVAGETFELRWMGAEGLTSIFLEWRIPTQGGYEVARNVAETNDTFTWKVPTNLVPRDYYYLVIIDRSAINFSPYFALSGDGTAATITPISVTHSIAPGTLPPSTSVPPPFQSTQRLVPELSSALDSSVTEPPSLASVSSTLADETLTTATSSGDSGSIGGSGGGGGPNSTIVGIAVGVSLGVVILGLLAGFYLYLRRKRRQSLKDESASQTTHSETDGSGVVGDEKSGEELGGNPVAEMHSPNYTHEVDGEKCLPVELSAENYRDRD